MSIPVKGLVIVRMPREFVDKNTDHGVSQFLGLILAGESKNLYVLLYSTITIRIMSKETKTN